MDWNKISKSKLNELKEFNGHILVSNTDSVEYPFDIIKFLDLKEKKKEVKFHWHSMLNDKFDSCYDDIDLLDIFTHFYFLKQPLNK